MSPAAARSARGVRYAAASGVRIGHRALAPPRPSRPRPRRGAAVGAAGARAGLDLRVRRGPDTFRRPGHHDFVSAQTLSLAANLSAEHRFALFHRKSLNEDGETEYDVYHRFPIGAYALVKVAALPFGDDFAARILAARALMLAFFAASAALATSPSRG